MSEGEKGNDQEIVISVRIHRKNWVMMPGEEVAVGVPAETLSGPGVSDGS